VSTMMLEANTSGNKNMKPNVITVVGVRINRPSTMNTQPMPKPMATSMAQDIAHHQARKRRKRPDRQRSEPVEQPLSEIGRQAHARIDGVEHHGLHENAGQEELQIFARRPGKRSAEDEGEEQREHDRRHDEIEELLRHVLEFQHGAPAEDERVGKRRRPRRPRPPFKPHQGRGLAHSLAPPWLSPLPWLSRLPVKAKKTSSRLGWPMEKSERSIPPATRAATASLAAFAVPARMESSAPSV